MTQKVEVTLYAFDELDDASKKRAINDKRDCINEDFPVFLLQNDLENMAIDYLADEKIKPYGKFSVEFSLSYSQGDGCRLIGMFEYRARRYEVAASRCYIGNHYSHAYSVTHEEVVDEEKEFNRTPKQIKAAELALEKWQAAYVRVCHKLEKYGYKWIDEELSEERIINEFKELDAVFTANGERWYM